MTELRIETVNINSLTPDPANARKHDGKNLKAIASSLEKFGQRKPIVVTPDSIVVAGNGTLEAAKSLGWTEIAIARTPIGWTWDQIKAFALADNRTAELAEWDDKVLADQLLELDANGWELEELGFENLEPPIGDDDEEPLSFDDAPTRAKLGDLWQLGNHKVFCGDSTDFNSYQKIIKDQTIGLIVTDPPYGIGIDGQKESINSNPKHNRKHHEFMGWDSQRPDQKLFQILLDFRVPTVIWGGNYFADLLPATRGWIYWNKGQDGLTMSDGELAWTSQDKPLRAVTVNRAALQGSVHPTQKPLEVIKFSIDYLESTGIVLDPFGGSGTTLIACEKNNKVCYAIELEPKYVDAIIKRWEDLTGKTAELIKD